MTLTSIAEPANSKIVGLKSLGPVVVMGFNRADYLHRTLISLKAQASVRDGSREVHLFQDGAVNFFSRERYATDEEIEQSVAVFKQVFPQGRIHLSKVNLGVALNFDRAEQYVFLDRKFDSCLFFEDDMVLGQNYIETLQRLLDYAVSDEARGRVGYVAAYGNHRASLKDQKNRCSEIVEMGHAWGYGVTREHWLRVREIIDPYLQIVSHCDYRKRPKASIGGAHKDLGMATRSQSQDAMKMIATAWLGRVRIMPFVCQAVYVGENGLNFTPEAFAARGYGKEVLFEETVDHFTFPTEDWLVAKNAEERERYRATCETAYSDRELPLPPLSRFDASQYLT